MEQKEIWIGELEVENSRLVIEIGQTRLPSALTKDDVPNKKNKEETMIQEEEDLVRERYTGIFFATPLLRTQERGLGVDCCPGLR